MNEQEFIHLLRRAQEGETEAVLSAVDAEPGLATRGNAAGGWWIQGLTLLHRASSFGHVDLARGLLDRGADPNSSTDKVMNSQW